MNVLEATVEIVKVAMAEQNYNYIKEHEIVTNLLEKVYTKLATLENDRETGKLFIK